MPHYFLVDIDYPLKTLNGLPRRRVNKRRTRVPVNPGNPPEPTTPPPPPIIEPPVEPPVVVDPIGTEYTVLPSGYTLRINADGLSEVSKSNVVVATGNLQIIDGTWFYLPAE